MEKISHILPPSRRVTAIETESSQPVRPGAPDFGRPKRSLEVQDRVSLSPMAREQQQAGAQNIAATSQDAATYKNPKETARAKVVDDLAEKFFNPAKFVKEGEGPRSEEVLKNIEDNKMFTPKYPTAAPAKTEADDSDLRQ